MKEETYRNRYDIAVIGAGHAGCEAGLAAARMGMRTVIFCTDIESVAMMPCNPSIGGTGKGHLVREVDALGGEMGVNIDKTFIQSKMLNTSKGPAVHSLRAQADKHKYHEEMLRTIRAQANLELIVAEVTDFIVDRVPADNANESLEASNRKAFSQIGSIRGVVTADGSRYGADAVIICTGTFLGGKIFIGDDVTVSGPSGMPPACELGEHLRELGFPIRRFKTGTPARMLRDTLDYNAMKEQKGDEHIVPFSFLNEDKTYDIDQISCWLSYTNEETHKIILDNIEKSAMYSGNIVGVGPRYCPSIEDKVSRFKDRKRHQLFVEPEGLDTDWMYIQGMSSSLPEDVQHAFYATIPGLEHAEIVRPAYAIEYDCVDPLSLKPSLESKLLDGLFCAGQFNGSSGYEEAAAQGLIAGINAVRKLRDKDPLVLRRDEAYIGVLIDDLVTKGTNEPYRIMTSRAEYRLLLRQDNADRRLTELGREYGPVTKERYDRYLAKKNHVDEEILRLRNRKTDIASFRKFLVRHECEDNTGELTPEQIERKRRDIAETGNQTFADILRRPAITYDDLAEIDDDTRPELGMNEKTEVEVMLKYDGYISKQINEVEKLRKLENKHLREDLDYKSIGGLRLEARQKLSEIRPRTVGQASRISGVSPADINVLLIYLEKEQRS
ncbi:MAG: tRNA uridine-5-carboxymethylaminomethyl(34) synthesis enzyme MnmG [Mogibacterium sp.]|nr:tRNA uridine-5-carboxymethylaminomethyl(34) synthesis enzyme MnmG [Mogibacterium sp.]MBQ6388024.1 tRNA uridine-5-carboxymethylaminomethyl(34) synthesis enzyme MnmG [Mogibacterium sp.]